MHGNGRMAQFQMVCMSYTDVTTRLVSTQTICFLVLSRTTIGTLLKRAVIGALKKRTASEDMT